MRCSPCLILSLNAGKQQQHPVNFSSYHSSNLFCALQKHFLADLLHSLPINRPLIASCLCSVVFCYCVCVGISRIKWTTWCECVCVLCVCVCVSWTEPSALCYLHVWFSSSLAAMGAYNRHPSGHDADLVCLSTPCKPEWGWDQCRSPPGSRLVVCAFVSMWISCVLMSTCAPLYVQLGNYIKIA